MEIISLVFFGYLKCLGSWWWITLSIVTFIAVVATVLKDDDYTLSTLRTLQLASIGTLSLIPIVINHLPFKLQMDFWTRWEGLGLTFTSFTSFTITFTVITFFAMPIVAVLVFGTKILDHYMSFACDVELYGFRQAAKRKLL